MRSILSPFTSHVSDKHKEKYETNSMFDLLKPILDPLFKFTIQNISVKFEQLAVKKDFNKYFKDSLKTTNKIIANVLYNARINEYKFNKEIQKYFENNNLLPNPLNIIESIENVYTELKNNKIPFIELYKYITDLLKNYEFILTKNSQKLNKEIRAKWDYWGKPLYDAPIRRRIFDTNFFYNYCEIFGGRKGELRQLESFVNEGSGIFFIEGISGMGKTALLANFVKYKPRIIYHFFSQSQVPESINFSLLGESIIEQIHFLEFGWLPQTVNFSREQLIKNIYEARYNLEKPIILVFDGLDELENIEQMKGIITPELPNNMKVIISARVAGEDGYEKDYYLNKIGLQRRNIRFHLYLERMGEMQIKDLFQTVSTKTNTIINNSKYFDIIAEKSEGDPFYLQFLIVDILDDNFDVMNLNKIPRGMQNYLLTEFRTLRKRVRGEDAINIIAVLSHNTDPIPEQNICELLKFKNYEFDDLIEPIRRYIIKRADGYTIIHPRLKKYFKEEIMNII
ncbi:MAG: hypothetical protein GF353_23350, partial [Candidatus Lokiarchaeota archaeon]|nr:hypothetical protein [Candidatus Lokiarchaeota archaeon]